jgi:hypothetical protein
MSVRGSGRGTQRYLFSNFQPNLTLWQQSQAEAQEHFENWWNYLKRILHTKGYAISEESSDWTGYHFDVSLPQKSGCVVVSQMFGTNSVLIKNIRYALDKNSIPQIVGAVETYVSQLPDTFQRQPVWVRAEDGRLTRY